LIAIGIVNCMVIRTTADSIAIDLMAVDSIDYQNWLANCSN